MFYIDAVINCIFTQKGWAVPQDPENTDYQAYLAWVAEGNSPLPWPPVS